MPCFIALPPPPPPQAFNRWLDARRAASPYPGLLVYPEGHCSTAGRSLPLKRGMLHYAFERRLPVQASGGALAGGAALAGGTALAVPHVAIYLNLPAHTLLSQLRRL